MSFDWMQNPRIYHREGASREQGLKAVAQRANLLCSLQHPRKAALARIEANVRWEFDPVEPEWMGEVKQVVADVYKRRGRA